MNRLSKSVKRTLQSGSIIFAMVLFVSACDGNGPGDDNDPGDLSPGTVEVNVTGAESISYTGIALSAGSEAQSGWGLVLTSENGINRATFATASDRPEEGNYSVVDFASTLTNNGDLVGAYISSQNSIAYLSNSGMFKVTKSSATEVEGTFTFSADDGSGGDVTVAGSFRSSNID